MIVLGIEVDKRNLNYPTLGVRTMADQEEQLLKETKRAKKRAAEDIEQLARDQARKLKAKKQTRE